MIELSDIKNEIEKAWNFSKAESEHEFKKHCLIAKADPNNIEHYLKGTIQKLSDFSDSSAGNYFINTPGMKIRALDDILNRLANTYNYGFIGNEYRSQIIIPGWDINKADKQFIDFIFADSRKFFLRIQTINLLNELLHQTYEIRNKKQETVHNYFETQWTEQELMTFFIKLQQNGYIHHENDIKQWLNICGINKEQNIEPIIWTGDTEELGHMANTLFGDTNRNRIWVKTSNLFRIKNEKPNIQVMKNAENKYQHDLNSKNIKRKFKKLDKALSL